MSTSKSISKKADKAPMFKRFVQRGDNGSGEPNLHPNFKKLFDKCSVSDQIWVLGPEDLHMLNNYRFNRDTKHQKVVEKSMNKYGNQMPDLIGIVDPETLEVLDGNARFDLCRRKGLPFYFKFKRSSMDNNVFVSMVNRHHKAWSIGDTVTQTLAGELPFMEDLMELIKGVSLNQSQVFKLLSIETNTHGWEEIANKELTEDMKQKVRHVSMLYKIISDNIPKRDRGHKTSFAEALKHTPNFNIERFKEQFEKYGKDYWVGSTDAGGIQEAILEIYNYNRWDASRIKDGSLDKARVTWEEIGGVRIKRKG